MLIFVDILITVYIIVSDYALKVVFVCFLFFCFLQFPSFTPIASHYINRS